MTYDVVVLGAGIIGASISRQLTRAGVQVCLVDAGDVGGGTSGRCDGNVLVQAKHDALGLAMTQYSVEGYRRWESELGPRLHFHQDGSLIVCTDAQEVAAARERVAWLTSNGVRARFVDASQVRELEPGLSDRVLGGIDCAEDASVYPPGVVAELVSDARQHGCSVLPHTRAERVVVSSTGQVDGVQTDAGLITAPTVVNALGVWSPQLAVDGGPRIPVAPRQGILAVIEESPGLVNRAVTEGAYMRTRSSPGDGDVAGIAFVAEPTFRGNVLIGSTRRFCGPDVTVDLALLHAVLSHAVAFLPALARLNVIRTFAGVRPWTPDNQPIIGRAEAVPGYLLATGHEGEGIGLAPITADIIVALVTGAALSPLFAQVLRTAAPDRFAGEGS